MRSSSGSGASPAVRERSGLFVNLGRGAIYLTMEVGAAGLLFWRGLFALRALPRYAALLVEQMRRIGVESLPLVIITSIFT
ncbi:MAG: hypothetical protein KAJ04_09035, partial [Candidatus Eisenbacteria sp.]|nr:hypothetical protein [Candidatus Eisenbacteria bacterium]